MSDISDKYTEAMTTSMNVQGKSGHDTALKNAQQDLERLEKDYKAGRIEQDEYVQKKAMLTRKITQGNPFP